MSRFRPQIPQDASPQARAAFEQIFRMLDNVTVSNAPPTGGGSSLGGGAVQQQPSAQLDSAALAIINQRLSTLESQTGTVAEGFVHHQSESALAWTIEHNLSRVPAVTVLDSVGRQLIATVDHNDAVAPTVTTIRFSIPYSGIARLI